MKLESTQSEAELPQKFALFEERVEVLGRNYLSERAAVFACSKDQSLVLEREFGHPCDPNAIRVIGCSIGQYGTRARLFIGYVPVDVSRRIVEGGFWGQVYPRLLPDHQWDQGRVQIHFQLLGPKSQLRNYLELGVARRNE